MYQAYADYIDMMNLTETMIASVCQEVCGGTSITYQDTAIDLTPPWRRATMHELVEEATGLDFQGFTSREAAAEAMRQAGLEVPDAADSVGRLLNEAFEQKVEGSLIQLTFVLDYPIEISPLARKHRSKPAWWSASSCSSLVANGHASVS